MDVSATFKKFIENLAVKNKEEISNRYKTITKTLNKSYWDHESDTYNSLMVGSYGRGTAINGISDLDMVFSLPWTIYDRFNSYETNGQSALLQEVKGVIKSTYSRTDIRGDGQVVVVTFNNHMFEVLPAFLNSDNSYTYPDTKNGGSWKKTKPRQEKAEMNNLNADFKGTLKHLCKMARAWKNKCGVPMGGLLVDTLAYNFLKSNEDYKDRSYTYYDWLCRDFFEYLKDTNKDQEYWLAPGSRQPVFKKSNFIPKAKKAYNECLEAIKKEDQKTVNKIWREIFGTQFPLEEQLSKSHAASFTYNNTEEFVEDHYLVNVRYNLEIDCHVKQNGFRAMLLSTLIGRGDFLKFGKTLRFFVRNCNVPEPYIIKWKVRNTGPEAEKRNMIRGQLLLDTGDKARTEHSHFNGSHYVECYVIKDGICLSRDRIDVPIKEPVKVIQ